MSSYVELDDKTRLPLSRLPERTPHSCFMSKLHAEICLRLVRRTHVPSELHDVYVNSMFKCSQPARQLTALVMLHRMGKLPVRRARAPFLDESFADLLEGVELQTQGRLRSLLPLSLYMRVCLKMLAHRFFRLFRRKELQAEQVVRAWVEASERIFSEETPHSALLIYPFHGSLRRQWHFVRSCRRRQQPHSLAGVPYRLRDVLGIVLPGGNRDRRVIEAEIRGYENHARELAAMGVRKLYTTDESEPASCRLHQALHEQGVWTCNRSHGVASYGPFVVYSHYSFYDERQREFYEEWGRIETSDLLAYGDTTRSKPRDHGAPYDPVVVVLLGNWRHSGKRYEAAFEEGAIDRAREICRQLELPLVIKPHPDLGLLRARWLKRRFGLPLLRDIEELAGRHPVFLNTASSAYRTYLADGPTVFLFEDFRQALSLFGEGIHGVPLEDLPAELVRFRDGEYWSERLNAQLTQETAGA